MLQAIALIQINAECAGLWNPLPSRAVEIAGAWAAAY
jgi:hypothetical protein